MASWAYEGIQCYVMQNQNADHKPLYRAWNGKDHFYTTSKNEYDNLSDSYQREGIACFIASSQLPDHVPLYRLYNNKTDDHFYTTSKAEKDRAVQFNSYRLEGEIGYAQTREDSNHVPLYRAYHPKIKDHFYTTSMNEIEAVAPKIGKNKVKEVLEKALDDCLNNVLKGGYKIFLTDSKYHPPQEFIAKQIVDDANIDQRRWISQKHDCDDFAHLLKSAFIEDAYTNGLRRLPYAFGIIWGAKPAHAMNFVITSNGTERYGLRIIEPQTGIFYKPSDKQLDDIYLIIV